jgi:hypothetical protein
VLLALAGQYPRIGTQRLFLLDVCSGNSDPRAALTLSVVVPGSSGDASDNDSAKHG